MTKPNAEGKEVKDKMTDAADKFRGRDFELHKRYLVDGEGWRHESETLLGFTYEDAGREASKAARQLDETYGDDHFWTVDLTNTDGNSYFQLFHGRLS